MEGQPCEVTIKICAAWICLLLELQIGHDSGLGNGPLSFSIKKRKLSSSLAFAAGKEDLQSSLRPIPTSKVM